MRIVQGMVVKVMVMCYVLLTCTVRLRPVLYCTVHPSTAMRAASIMYYASNQYLLYYRQY